MFIFKRAAGTPESLAGEAVRRGQSWLSAPGRILSGFHRPRPCCVILQRCFLCCLLRVGFRRSIPERSRLALHCFIDRKSLTQQFVWRDSSNLTANKMGGPFSPSFSPMGGPFSPAKRYAVASHGYAHRRILSGFHRPRTFCTILQR